MCGIFGIVAQQSVSVKKQDIHNILNTLYILSEARGKESAGISIKNTKDKRIHVLKKSIPASKFIKSTEYQHFFQSSVQSVFDDSGVLQVPLCIIAHARLVTNGTQENNNNNQPVIKNDCVGVHNGIITNVDELWTKYNQVLQRELEVDTEVFLALLRYFIAQNVSLSEAVQRTFRELKGTASVAIQLADFNTLILATNNGSLYYSTSLNKDLLLFASEKYILSTCIKDLKFQEKFKLSTVEWLKPFTGIIVGIDNPRILPFQLNDSSDSIMETSSTYRDEIVNYSEDKPIDFEEIKKQIHQLKISPLRNLLEYNVEAIKQLRRCSKCLLPETFPFIEYDEKGVCNYCRSYIVRNLGSKEKEFRELLNQYRSKDGSPDCLVPFSGGRDSSYGLHYIVHELGMHPITYTYDWGMVTDLARRNIARLCGKLGIENIIVSADIHQKRRNIKLNVEAWLKNPKLGLIPLFMAGDKQFFYYVNQVKRQTGIKMDIWCTNYLENTDFKVGFCDVRPTFDKHRPDYLPLSSKLKMAWYYLKNFIINPSYINSSIYDTIFSFYAYYAEPRIHFYQLYDWVKWDENVIAQTLIKEYNWELSPDTTSTWRIGDGTAAFYNYIYYTIAGFSEIDTFRSNQIREGLISREEALGKIYEENKPRFESLKWYLDTINVDFETAIKKINSVQKLYKI